MAPAITRGSNETHCHHEKSGMEKDVCNFESSSFFTDQIMIAAIFGLQMAMSQMGKPMEDSGVWAPETFNINTNDMSEIIKVNRRKPAIGLSAKRRFILPIAITLSN
tara:strand:+ start:1038 stop:1358 length:321 start_codon:yes stop_codon:yes gene_type:complete